MIAVIGASGFSRQARNAWVAFAGFTAVMGHHKVFHCAASNVMALAQSGQQAKARKRMDVQFRDYCIATIDSLNSPRRAIARLSAKRK